MFQNDFKVSDSFTVHCPWTNSDLIAAKKVRLEKRKKKNKDFHLVVIDFKKFSSNHICKDA